MNKTLTIKLELPSIMDCAGSPVCQDVMKWGLAMLVISFVIMLLLLSVLIVVSLNHTLAVKKYAELEAPTVAHTGLTTISNIPCNV